MGRLAVVATPHTEAQLLDYAQQATAEQVQRRCQQLRNADRAASTHGVNEIHRNRFLCRSLDGSGRMTISVELTEEAGALVMAALERAASCRSRAFAVCAAMPPPWRSAMTKSHR